MPAQGTKAPESLQVIRKGMVIKMGKVVVSACLLGRNCKYSGGNNYSEKLHKWLEGKEVIEVCPEVAGGLPTPRTPVELVNGVATDRDWNSFLQSPPLTETPFNAILKQDKPMNESSSYPKICREPCISCKCGILEDKEWTHEGNPNTAKTVSRH